LTFPRKNVVVKVVFTFYDILPNKNYNFKRKLLVTIVAISGKDNFTIKSNGG
jgi:hypothetical protein